MNASSLLFPFRATPAGGQPARRAAADDLTRLLAAPGATYEELAVYLMRSSYALSGPELVALVEAMILTLRDGDHDPFRPDRPRDGSRWRRGRSTS